MSGKKGSGGRRARGGRAEMLFTNAAENVAREVTASASEKSRRPKPSTRVNKKGLVIYVAPDVTKVLRRLAIDRDTSVQDLGLLAISLLFEHCRVELPAGLPAIQHAPIAKPATAKRRVRPDAAA